MAQTTIKLGLVKGDPSDVFDFTTFLNANWDKIESMFGAANGFATLGADGKVLPAQATASSSSAINSANYWI